MAKIKVKNVTKVLKFQFEFQIVSPNRNNHTCSLYTWRGLAEPPQFVKQRNKLGSFQFKYLWAVVQVLSRNIQTSRRACTLSIWLHRKQSMPWIPASIPLHTKEFLQ